MRCARKVVRPRFPARWQCWPKQSWGAVDLPCSTGSTMISQHCFRSDLRQASWGRHSECIAAMSVYKESPKLLFTYCAYPEKFIAWPVDESFSSH
mmetsp:Transcript_43630/g.102904  ORF Transcript_43630/g.102904 Transcript_43630/m.102904 type:complete len:95 (+) Transcript_43630:3065-3349(+)